MSSSLLQELYPNEYKILMTHPIVSLRRHITKSNIRLSFDHKRLTKEQLIAVMLVHINRFPDIKEHPQKPKKERKVRPARGPKRTPAELKLFRQEQGRRLAMSRRQKRAPVPGDEMTQLVEMNRRMTAQVDRDRALIYSLYGEIGNLTGRS